MVWRHGWHDTRVGGLTPDSQIVGSLFKSTRESLLVKLPMTLISYLQKCVTICWISLQMFALSVFLI